MVLTGDGKGKTTSAFGQVLRACGQGLRCLVVQFIKSPKKYGEVTAVKCLQGVEVRTMGIGFVGDHGQRSEEEHRKAALEALEYCTQRAREGGLDLLVLDEVNFALSTGLILEREILGFLDGRPEGLTVILTGRGAPGYIVDRADLVTEMEEIKHPYNSGIKAQRGIEF
jgi:cob(I)alamin adenosyltransferase